MTSSTPRSRRASRTGTAAFLRRAITDQTAIGAVAPTLPFLARRLAGLVPPTPGLRVLELGAGTGAVSTAIGPRLGPGALHIAVERDPELLATLEHRAPWALRMAGDAAEVGSQLAASDIPEVDVVISALPWGYFAPPVQRRILGEICSVLVPGGLFATIVCRPARLNPRSRGFRALAESAFKEVVATGTTWVNIPPARLLVCRGPRPDVFDDA
jgi:phosphatidylethanolamine/phosphatidyl-N-methylethanolamine N-methyltransferase